MTVQRTDSEVCYALVLYFVVKSGAQSRNRTSDTRIFNPLLYRLSYLGPDQTANWRRPSGGLIRQGIGAVQRGLQEK